VVNVIEAALEGPTVNDPDTPVKAPCVAVSVVVCASYNVMDGLPTPLEKLTDAGYNGAVPPGELEGPEKVTVFDPV
jgi:hypothetical protein